MLLQGQGTLAEGKCLEDWNVCHRSEVALSALVCVVCRGGVECNLHENGGGERDRGIGKLGVGGRGGGLKSRERIGARTEKVVSWGKGFSGSVAAREHC